MTTTVPWSEHVAGQRNDVVQWRDPAIDRWPLEEIAVPTLILHGDADQNTSYENSRAAAARSPNAELVTFEGGDHFVMISRWREVSGVVDRFLTPFLPLAD
jgi:pimeloyl-ACP methyl ester carboxylesterase